MKQIALDIGTATAATFGNFFAGTNQAALSHLRLWASSAVRSPVPTYLWGDSGSGKTHLLHAAVQALHTQGERIGWLDAAQLEPGAFDDSWAGVVLDDCHLYTAVQQAAAFNWFVNAPTWRCGTTCAAAWVGAMSLSCTP
jgi:DnaA-homolog protein